MYQKCMCFVFRENNREINFFFWPSEVTKTPLLVQFGLNLGLNNLKFGQKAISDRIDSKMTIIIVFFFFVSYM